MKLLSHMILNILTRIRNVINIPLTVLDGADGLDDFQHNYDSIKVLKGTYLSRHFHSPFNKILESYYSIDKHFKSIDACDIMPMDLHNFFGYSVFSKTPMLRIFEGIFIFYIKIIDKLPEIFRKSFLNPNLIVRIIKK